MSPKIATKTFPEGPRLTDASRVGLLPGQPSAVAEMAIALARKLARHGTYDPKLAVRVYNDWLDSEPFRVEPGLKDFLRNKLDSEDNPDDETDSSLEASGSILARCVPIAMISVRLRSDIRLTSVAEWAVHDASLTHPDKETTDVAALFASLLSEAMEAGTQREALLALAAKQCRTLSIEDDVLSAIKRAAKDKPDQTMPKGALKTLCCALWHATQIKEPEKAIITAAMSGDQPSANAAATGALVGAMYGLRVIPAPWAMKISTCRPKTGQAQVRYPRPRLYWPSDIDSLATSLSWSEGASAVPVFQQGNTKVGAVNDVEQTMRALFESLVERASTGCQDSLKQIGEMAKTETGIDARHMFMFSDFAMVLRKRGWLQLALTHAERVVSLAPEDSNAHFNLARIHWQMGDNDKAREELAETLRITPDMEYAKSLLDVLDGKAPGA